LEVNVNKIQTNHNTDYNEHLLLDCQASCALITLLTRLNDLDERPIGYSAQVI